MERFSASGEQFCMLGTKEQCAQEKGNSVDQGKAGIKDPKTPLGALHLPRCLCDLEQVT